MVIVKKGQFDKEEVVEACEFVEHLGSISSSSDSPAHKAIKCLLETFKGWSGEEDLSVTVNEAAALMTLIKMNFITYGN